MSSDVMQHELVERARENGTLTKADITKAWFIYWLGAEVSSSYERLQSLIFCASMTPIIKKLYPQKEEQVEALKRHLNFFNSEQTFGAVIQGISIAMEEQKTRGEPISDASITGIKTGLMGPLVPEWGTPSSGRYVMPLLIAIFIPFAASGSAMGGIVPLILYPVPLRWRSATAWCTKATRWDATQSSVCSRVGELRSLSTARTCWA